MKTTDSQKCRKVLAIAAACLALGGFCRLGQAQSAPGSLSPPLQEVLKLTQAHMQDDIILAYVKNSGQAYNLSADDILYLNSQGVSQAVLTALLQSKSATPATPAPAAPVSLPAAPANPVPATPPPMVSQPVVTQPAVPVPTPAPAAPYVMATPPPGSMVNLRYFEGQLAPYGSWVDLPVYGPAWRPNDALADPLWRPYFDRGYWQYTEAGWYWNSELPYGDVVFHYGRWVKDYRYGWVWVPGYDWAPAWVAWRQAEGYAGWAPLPPAAYYEPGVGLMFGGRLALDIDFGLVPDDFVFIGYDHFWDHGYRPFLVPRERIGLLYRSSFVLNGYRVVDGRFAVEGFGRDRIAALTHRAVGLDHIAIHDARISKAREFDRAHAIQRDREIRSRPAGDPLRSAVESRDHQQSHGGGGRGER